MAAWPGWQVDVLSAIGAPASAENLRLFTAWQGCEGGLAAWNPLNTTQPEPAATDYNSVGVKNYPTKDVGILATKTALENGRYDGIVSDLRAGTFTAAAILTRNGSEFSTWGTSVQCISRNVGAGLAPPQYPVQTGKPDRRASPHSPGAWHDFTRALGHGLTASLYTTRRVRGHLYRRVR